MSLYLDESLHEQLSHNRLICPANAICGIKDINHQIVAINDRTANLVGYKSAKQLIKLRISDNDIECDAKNLGHQFQKEDQLSEKQPSLTTLTWATYADSINHLLLTEKSILLNEKNEKIGYFIYSLDLTHHNILNLQSQLSVSEIIKKTKRQFSKVIYPGYPDVKLTQKQSICLYYILNGYSSNAISKILHLSKRTVESYIENIKNKFHCDSKQQLIELAISKGYLEIIPKAILGFDY
jgi:DNA-binding CsgD family transcriptional regulator